MKDPEANKELLAPHKVDTSDYEKKVQMCIRDSPHTVPSNGTINKI